MRFGFGGTNYSTLSQSVHLLLRTWLTPPRRLIGNRSCCSARYVAMHNKFEYELNIDPVIGAELRPRRSSMNMKKLKSETAAEMPKDISREASDFAQKSVDQAQAA